jgi:Zn finger protein HypA/HybF involved in hydrogenase expression
MDDGGVCGRAGTAMDPEVQPVLCPICGSHKVELFSLWGSLISTSQYYCLDCRTVFEHMKWQALDE